MLRQLSTLHRHCSGRRAWDTRPFHLLPSSVMWLVLVRGTAQPVLTKECLPEPFEEPMGAKRKMSKASQTPNWHNSEHNTLEKHTARV